MKVAREAAEKGSQAMKHSRFQIVLCGLVLAATGSLPAQTYQGRILGTIRDSSGGVIVDAKVTVTNTGKKVSRDLVTNSVGAYVAPALEPGVYVVSAQAPGFKRTESSPFRLEVAKDVEIDLQLQPGGLSEVVTVNEEAAPLIDTTNPTLGGSFGNKEINELPLQGRDWQNLVMLRPGIDRTPGGGFHSITANGNRPEDNNYIIDGSDDNDPYYATTVANEEGVSGTPATHLPLDAIQEFTAEEHPTAEYGWKPGAAINIGIKSGTNEFHGTAYYFHRNDALDARNFFNPVGNPISPIRLHQFGASAGGPIKKDKLFIFGTYEGVRHAVGNPGVVPSPATVSVGDPANSLPDAIALCNSTPGCTPNPLSVKLAQLYPPNNGTNVNGNNQIFQDLVNVNREDNFIIKSDYHLSEHHSITGRYFFGDSNQTEEDIFVLLPQFQSQALTRAQLVGAGWTWTPNSRWVNEARFGYTRLSQQLNSVDHSTSPSSYGINTGVTNPADFGLLALQVASFTQLGGNAGFPLFTTPNYSIQFSDNVSLLTGRHAIRFGAEFRYGGTDNLRDSDAKGTVFFPTLADFIDSGSTDTTGALGCSNGPGGACGPQQGTIFVGNSRRKVSLSSVGLYGQDEFRLRPNFTVTAGLRYDASTVIHENKDLLANFDPDVGFVQVGKQISSPYNGDHDNFAPRLGFAWDVSGHGKTVIRAGSGIIYEVPHISAFIGQTLGGGTGLGNIPTGAIGVVPGGGTIATTQVTLPGTSLNWNSPPAQVFPNLGVPLDCSQTPCSITWVKKNLETPYSIFWNLNIQRAIGKTSSLQVGYVANRGDRLYSILDLNQPDGPTAANCFAVTSDRATCEQQARPFFTKFPFLGEATQVGNAENSIYHSLQVTWTVKGWKGLYLVAGYTYGHAIDDASNNRAFFAENSFNLAAERGNSDFDVRHRFTLAITYPLPSRRGFAHLLEGWQVNSIAIIETGMPFDIHDFVDDISFSGDFGDRWNFFGQRSDITWSAAPIPQQNCDPNVRLCFFPDGTLNPSCVAHASLAQLGLLGCFQEKNSVIVPPDPGTFGITGRNAFRGPDFVNWDFSVSKNTRLTERLTLQLRFEFFNILNHPIFTGVDGEVADGSSLGQVVNTPDVFASNPVIGSGGSRHIQVGAKFIW